MDSSDKAALALFRLHPSATDVQTANVLLKSITDEKQFGDMLVRLGIAPLVYHNKAHYNLTAGLLGTVTAAYHRTLLRSMRLSAAFQEIANVCAAQGIEIIPLKGIYLSEALYGNIGLRLMSDMDILVKEHEAMACINAIRQLGYSQADQYDSDLGTEIVHYEPLVKNGLSVEIHIKLHRIIEKYSLSPTLLWQHAKPARVHGCDVLSLDMYDTLIFCCLHLDRHFQNKGIQFTGYADMVNLLSDSSKDFDFNILENRCKMYNCSQEVYIHMLLVHKYMHIDLPERFLKIHASLLSKVTEERFISFLQGNTAFDTGMPRHFSNLIFIDGWFQKMLYIFRSIFPPASFIRNKYNLSPETSVFKYYIHRLFTGLKGVFLLMRKKG